MSATKQAETLEICDGCGATAPESDTLDWQDDGDSGGRCLDCCDRSHLIERLAEARAGCVERFARIGQLAGDNERLRARLAALEAQAGAQRAALLWLEWRPCHPECTERFCPACRAHEAEGHREGCELAGALASTSGTRAARILQIAAELPAAHWRMREAEGERGTWATVVPAWNAREDVIRRLIEAAGESSSENP